METRLLKEGHTERDIARSIIVQRYGVCLPVHVHGDLFAVLLANGDRRDTFVMIEDDDTIVGVAMVVCSTAQPEKPAEAVLFAVKSGCDDLAILRHFIQFVRRQYCAKGRDVEYCAEHFFQYQVWELQSLPYAVTVERVRHLAPSP